MKNPRLVAIAQTLTILIFMSLGTVITKITLEDVAPLTFAWLSVMIGMVLLSVYTFVIRGERIPKGLSRQIWTYIIIIGLFNFVVGRITMTISLERLPATTNTYLVNFIGFITMGMSIFMLKESPTIFQVLGALIAIVGLRVFFDEPPTGYEFVGILLILVGITAVAYTNNIARKLGIVTENKLSNNIVSTMALLIGGSLLTVIGLAVDGVPRVEGLGNWIAIAYAGVVMVAFGLTVWNHILRVLRSYEASILGASTVIWTALLAIPILGETLKANQVLGMALMLAGLALVQVRRGSFNTLWRRLGIRPGAM
ncbi:MAG TPA: DMT family transporter [Anaerolineales bacterium]|nr:DMT family transporter [Anaerolineales bacterium]